MRLGSRRGGALVAALIVVTLVAAMGAGLVQVASSQLRRQAMSVDTRRALYAAEAGLSEAWIAIAQGKSGNVGTPALPAAFSGGVYWVEATWLPEDLVQLRSTGLVGRGRFAIEAVVQRPANPYAELGVFGDASVVVRRESTIDGWDSAMGGYKPLEARGDDEQVSVRVSSNGDLTVKGTTTDPDLRTMIHGDLQAGAEGLLSLGSGVLVTGSTAPKAAAADVPQVEVPELARAHAITFSSSATLSQDVLGFDAVRVAPGVTLNLEGPLELVVGALTVDPKGRLRIDGSQGPVSIYVDGPAHLPAGAVLETVGGSADSTALFLLEGWTPPGTPASQDMPELDFSPEGEFRGVIFAPGASLVVPSSLRLLGSVAAGRLELAQGSRITFDVESRRNPSGGVQEPRFVTWRLIELPDVPLVVRRIDPLAQLGLAGVQPLSPTDAHLEKEIDLVYLDACGERATYAGHVDSFDWSNVSRILTNTWCDSPVPKDEPTAPPADDPPLGDSSVVKAKLLAASPLPPWALFKLMVAHPKLSSSDRKDVLLANSPLPLSEHILFMASHHAKSPLSSSDLTEVLVANSPLPGSVLKRAEGHGKLSASDKATILAAQ